MIKKISIGLYDKETGEIISQCTRELPSERRVARSYDDSPLAMFMKRWVECAIRGAVNEKKTLSLVMDLDEPTYTYVMGKIPF